LEVDKLYDLINKKYQTVGDALALPSVDVYVKNSKITLSIKAVPPS
jgi:hypothetical protein